MTAGPTNELPPVHEAWLPKEHSLHRPRHGKRQLTALVSALVFFATPALMWVFGMRASEIENHKLAEFPAFTDGWGLFTGLDEWATDNLVFRGAAVNATDWVSRSIFGEPAPFDQGGGSKPTGPLPGSPAEPQPDPQQAEPGGGSNGGGNTGDGSDAGFRRVIEGSDDWLYFGTDTLNKCHPTAPLDQTIAQLVKLRTAVEASGRRFELVVVPDKTTMVPEYLPDTYPGKDCANAVTPDLWQKAIQVAGALDIRPRLAAAEDKLGRPVYYPQDTHWTNEGALAMVDSLAEDIKPGVTDRWKVQAGKKYSAPADLPPLIGKDGQNNATSYKLLPNGRTDRADPGTNELFEPRHRKSSPLTGQVFTKTTVLGDSFLVAASRYLPAAFSDVTMQYYLMAGRDASQVIRTIGDAETVVLEVVERNIAAGTPEILSQAFIDTLAGELAKRPVR